MGNKCGKTEIEGPISAPFGGSPKNSQQDYQSFGVHPPHQVLHEDIGEISRTYKFFVHLWGVKCRNLKGASNCFVVVNWDDYAFEKKTKPVQMGNFPRFNEAFQFTWTTSSIKGMEQKILEVSVYEDDKHKGILLGSVKVDLYEIATGPVHHDLKLNPNPQLKGKFKDCSGRIVFDLQMSQICQLIINPVEIVAHINEAITNGNNDRFDNTAASVTGGGGSTASSIIPINAYTSVTSPSSSAELTSPSSPKKKKTKKNKTPEDSNAEGKSSSTDDGHEENSANDDDDDTDDEPEMLKVEDFDIDRSISQERGKAALLSRVHANNSAGITNKRSTPNMSSSPMSNSQQHYGHHDYSHHNSKSTSLTPSAIAFDNLHETTTVSVQDNSIDAYFDDEAVDDHHIDGRPSTAGGGASGDDEVELVDGEWFLAFDPTGLAEGLQEPYRSDLTEKCTQPSWSSLVAFSEDWGGAHNNTSTDNSSVNNNTTSYFINTTGKSGMNSLQNLIVTIPINVHSTDVKRNNNNHVQGGPPTPPPTHLTGASNQVAILSKDFSSSNNAGTTKQPEVYSEPPDLSDMRALLEEMQQGTDVPSGDVPSGELPPDVAGENQQSSHNEPSSHPNTIPQRHSLLNLDSENAKYFNSNTVGPGSELQSSLGAWRASGTLDQTLPSIGKMKYGLKLEPLSSTTAVYNLRQQLEEGKGGSRPIQRDQQTGGDLSSLSAMASLGAQRGREFLSAHRQELNGTAKDSNSENTSTSNSNNNNNSNSGNNLLLRDAPADADSANGKSGHRRGASSTLGLFDGLTDEELKKFSNSNASSTNNSLTGINKPLFFKDTPNTNNNNNNTGSATATKNPSPPPSISTPPMCNLKNIPVLSSNRMPTAKLTRQLSGSSKRLSVPAGFHSASYSNLSNGGTSSSEEPPLVPQSVTTPLPVTPPLLNSTSLHSAHVPQASALDLQASYRKLAEICKGERRLARELLSPILPTMQIETTVEQLRQQHITVRLYVQRLGSDPRLFGEVWLPFVKLYDADIVDDIDKNFHDSYFKEPIWLYGRCRGYLEGLVLFQNNPVVAQMLSGVHTEEGRKRISPVIMPGGNDGAGTAAGGTGVGVSSFLVRSEHLLPPEIKKVALLHSELLDQLFRSKANSGNGLKSGSLSATGPTSSGSATGNSSADLSSICEQLLLLLKQSHAETRKSYMYASSHALLTGQRVLLSLGNHILDYLDSVQFNVRPLYSAVLHQIFKRGELDIGTCVPELPMCMRDVDLRVVYRVYRLIKKRHRARLVAAGLLDDHESEGNNQGNSKKKNANSNNGRKGLLHNVLFKRRQSESVQVTHDIAEMSDDDDTDAPAIPSPQNIPSSYKELACVGDLLAAYKRFGETKEEREKRNAKAAELIDKLTINDSEEVILFHLRMRTSLSYLQMLYRTLYYSLDKFSNDAVFEGQKRFLSIFLCISYFRIPSFRGDLLSGILSDAELKLNIPEWRGTEFPLDEMSLMKMRAWSRQSELRITLDWTALYQAVFGYYGPHCILEHAIYPLMQPRSDLWKERLFKRSTAFFSFLDNWCKHVYQAASRRGEGLRWQGVPGYPHLLKALLIEMKSRDVTKYPDSLLNCSGALLANERLLSVFVKVIFLRTSAFNSSAVFASLNYLDYWTQVISLRGVSLPSSFDMTFLVRGIETLLCSGVCLNVSKTLWFLYKNLLVFSGARLKAVVLDLLLDRHFIPLLASWAWIVRRCFIWILLYRVCESARHVMMRHVPHSQLSNDEKLILEAYRVLSERFQQLGAPAVFPQSKLYSALGFTSDGVPDPTFHPNGYEGFAVRAGGDALAATTPARRFSNFLNTNGSDNSLGNETGKSASKRLSNALNTGAESSSTTNHASPSLGPSAPPPLPTTSIKIDHTEGGHRLGSHSTFDGEAATTLVGAAGLEKLRGEGLMPLSGRDPYKPYLDLAVVEISRELSSYRDWVIAGGEHLPVLHIPSTPLDYTVDVPLENW